MTITYIKDTFNKPVSESDFGECYCTYDSEPQAVCEGDVRSRGGDESL